MDDYIVYHGRPMNAFTSDSSGETRPVNAARSDGPNTVWGEIDDMGIVELGCSVVMSLLKG